VQERKNLVVYEFVAPRSFYSVPLSTLFLPFLTLSDRPPNVLVGDRGAILVGEQGGGSFSRAAARCAAREAEAEDEEGAAACP